MSMFGFQCGYEILIDWDDGPVNGGIPCLWFPAPKAATVILFFHANADPWNGKSELMEK